MTLRGRRAFVRTMGCQMNRHDSARMAEILLEAGCDPADDPAGADVLVLNTCSVRGRAENKARSAIGEAVRWKRARPGRRIVLAGCVAQQFGRRWLEIEPEVDAVIGPDGIAGVARILEEIDGGARPTVEVGFDGGAAEDFPPSRPDLAPPGPTAFVTVSKGCDERCTFCIVPSVRGPLRSRPLRDVAAEAEALVAAGTREIVLIGQAVNAYRHGDAGFGTLVRLVGAIPGIARLRYTSPHPRFVDDDLVAAHAETAAMCEHVHLPVQSGSDRVLRRMGRGYTRERYLAIVERLRAARPGTTFGTDVIVGFPGETEADFEETMSLVAEVRPTQVFSFAYSARPGTPAERWEDDVPAPEKSRRLRTLQELAERLARERLASLTGTTVEVLVEGPSDRGGGSSQGRTRNNDVVHVVPPEGRERRPGTTLRVRIEEALPHCLRGSPERDPGRGTDRTAAVAP